jgi:hypothetical protein
MNNQQPEEFANEGTFLPDSDELLPTEMSVDEQQQTENSGGGRIQVTDIFIFYYFFFSFLFFSFLRFTFQIGIKISEMINNEPSDAEAGDELEGEGEEEEEEEVPESTISQPSQLPSAAQSSTTSLPSSASTAPPQLNDAFAYLDKVRTEFADQPEIYNKFLQTMREFKANT